MCLTKEFREHFVAQATIKSALLKLRNMIISYTTNTKEESQQAKMQQSPAKLFCFKTVRIRFFLSSRFHATKTKIGALTNETLAKTTKVKTSSKIWLAGLVVPLFSRQTKLSFCILA
jgi:hypothetical protein